MTTHTPYATLLTIGGVLYYKSVWRRTATSESMGSEVLLRPWRLSFALSDLSAVLSGNIKGHQV